MQKSRWFQASFALVVLSLPLFSGCGPADGLATVVGHVTLDGQPLADAYVQFTCTGKDAGRFDGAD